jgi:hypothetical protein
MSIHRSALPTVLVGSIMFVYGCEQDNTQKRLERTRECVEQRCKHTETMLADEIDLYQELHRAFNSATVQTLQSQNLVFARLRIMDKRVAVAVDWIAKDPTMDAVRVEAGDGTYRKDFPIPQYEHDGLKREAQSWVGYTIWVILKEPNKDGAIILELTRKGKAKAALVYKGKVISNAVYIKPYDRRKK